MVGATGKYASHVVPKLKQRGVTVRALVRDKDKVDAARQQGADEAIVGDLRDAESLRAAAKGVEGIFHLNPAFAPDEGELGVAWSRLPRHLVCVSSSSPVSIHPSLSKQYQAWMAVVEAISAVAAAIKKERTAVFVSVLKHLTVNERQHLVQLLAAHIQQFPRDRWAYNWLPESTRKLREKAQAQALGIKVEEESADE